jgi:hypothetical protein
MTHEEYCIQLYANALSAPTDEWRIILYFYSAVHAANHALYGGVNVSWSQDHQRRELDMDGHKLLRTRLGKYRRLRQDSEIARYKPWLHPLPPEKVITAQTIAKEIAIACGIVV